MHGGHVASSQMLEVNLISARDLAPVSKSMKTFAVAWIQPDRKLKTRVDPNGHTNPAWNDKLLFRVDNDSFLNDPSASLTIEIYASSSRGTDALIGTVIVLISNLFPPCSSSLSSHNMRFLTLQIRRPSGRAQGVLNIGAALLEGTRRSFDLSSVGYSDLVPDPKMLHNNVKDKNSNKIQLRHSKSARSVNEFARNRGLVMAGSLCSDVGPSPSVVAAAIAMGLYPTAAATAMEDDRTVEGSSVVLEDWIEEDDSVEGLKTKIERWRSEIHPIYEKQIYHNYGRSSYRRNNEPKQSEHRRARSGGGLFSCFGTAYGCEFSISCGGGNRRKKLDNGDKSHLRLSELSYNDPYV